MSTDCSMTTSYHRIYTECSRKKNSGHNAEEMLLGRFKRNHALHILYSVLFLLKAKQCSNQQIHKVTILHTFNTCKQLLSNIKLHHFPTGTDEPTVPWLCHIMAKILVNSIKLLTEPMLTQDHLHSYQYNFMENMLDQLAKKIFKIVFKYFYASTSGQ